ncbi:MAG TPA: LssY C-terminal domain-containing protein [Candidatus Udaeobacter sp.]|nr:LssY C-terminal domain-containing protein [Candidatus Udaeobacter sp.]
MNYLNLFLPIFEHYSLLAYFFVLAGSFLESFVFLGIIVPGTTLLVAAGFLASQGFFHLGVLFILSLLGAVLGDNLSFYLGNHSEKLFKPDSRVFKLIYLERGKNFFAKHGNYSVFLARFIGPLRPIVPFVAGISGMDRKKFTLYNILSAILWSGGYLFLGYFFGRAWQAVSVWSTRLSVIFFWLAVFLAVFFILKWLFIKKGKSVLKFFISLLISIGEGIKDNQDVQSFFAHHPVLAGFLKKRFDRTKFSGLTLTFLALLLIYAVSSFVGTVKDVFINGSILSVDLSLANLLHAFRNPLLVKIFLWVTLLGKWEVVLSVIVVTTVIFWLRDKKNYVVPFFVSVTGSSVMGLVGKYIWQRPRPLEVAVYLEKSWSFPSQHAILAVSLYGFLVYFFWKYFKRWKNRMNALFFGFLVVVFVGFSRLYLGVHYLSDVWAGYMIGFFWLLISIGLVEFKDKSKIEELDENDEDGKEDEIIKAKPNVNFITVAMLCLLAAGYIAYGLKYKPVFSQGVEEENIHKIDTAKAEEIFTEYKLPKFTETLLGNPQEPFSFIIVADNDNQLIESFQRAGWFLADSVNLNSLLTTFKFEVLNKAYPTAPITPYFWQTDTNDFGFEEPTEVNSARYRHHARFWRTDSTTDSGKNIYVGVASLDMGVKWWGITHKIKPDIDSERDYLFKALSNAVVVENYSKEQFVDPVLGKNFTGDQFFTDGKVYVIFLK